MKQRICPPNLAQLFILAAERYGDRPAFATRKRAGEWDSISFRQMHEMGSHLATALIELGVGARDHVGLFADNRREWILADCAVQLCGAADVPRAADVTDGELSYILNHAGIRVAFVENDSLQRRLLRLREEIPNLQTIILLDSKTKPAEGVVALTDLIERGKQLRADGNRDVEKRVAAIDPEDLFTLIYTSGTTGQPKGVMLSHANMVSQLKNIPIEINPSDRVLSILPVWHIFERVFEVLAISCGACTYYSSIRTLGNDLQTVAPTFMGSAPRLWENLHQRILKTVETAPAVRRLLFHAAYSVSHQYQDSDFSIRRQKLALSPEEKRIGATAFATHYLRRLLLKPLFHASDAVVFRKIRENIGGELKATISGGGALPPEIDRFFNGIGIPVLEGYGMTETSPVLSVRTHQKLVVGTVGPPIPQTDIRIVDSETHAVLFPNPELPHEGRGLRGEICVRGPQVMKGYYRDPESTAQTLRNGWLHTGDLGMLTFNGCLKILGRCKDTIVLRSGENLEPVPIEMRLSQSPLIEQCMIVGQDQKFIAALIVPSLDGFREHGIAAEAVAELSEKPETEELIRREIREHVSEAAGFKAFERIRDFRLLPEPFTIGSELTNLFKLKRHVVETKYKDLIDEIFQQDA